MHPILVANVLELQAIRLLLFGIADRTNVDPSFVKRLYERIETELITEMEKEKDNDGNKSSEGGV